MNPKEILANEMAIIVDDSLEAIHLLLAPEHDTHAAAELAAAAWLIGQLRHRLPHLVAEARDQDTPWGHIASQLHHTRLGAMARYAHHARTRPQPNLD